MKIIIRPAISEGATLLLSRTQAKAENKHNAHQIDMRFQSTNVENVKDVLVLLLNFFRDPVLIEIVED